MKSFKEAAYLAVTIAGNDAAYSEDDINDKLPEGYYKYYFMLNGEQGYISDKKNKKEEGIVITTHPMDISSMGHESAAVRFEDKSFSFESFFKGYHRPIDFQIKTAEDKKNAQFQNKSRNKDINIGRDDI